MPGSLRPARHEVPTVPLFADRIDIERSCVIRDGSVADECFVVIEWCHRWPVAWLTRGDTESPVQFAYGPSVTTELHVVPSMDIVRVISTPVPAHVESVLIAHVAGLFAETSQIIEAA
jgi:hypothetical protein